MWMVLGFHLQNRPQPQGQWIRRTVRKHILTVCRPANAVAGKVNSVLFWKVNQLCLESWRPCRSSLAPLSTFLHCRAYYGNINFFGGPSATSVKASAKLKQLEEENEDAMFVVVSDVWLDNIEVMEKLSLMFSGVCFLWVFTWPNTHTNPLHSVTRKLVFQVTPPCLQLVSSFVATSHLPPMETDRFNPSKVEY